MSRIIIIIAVLLLSGCSTNYLRAQAEYFNSRNIKACLCGDLNIGGGFGATVNGEIGALIATGEATIAQCKEAVECE